MRSDLVQMIEKARFTPVRAMSGYDMGEVDQLLDRVVAALGEGRDVLPVIDGARFSPTKWREGYSSSDVDELLARLRAEVGGAPLAGPSQTDTDAAGSARPDVISEQRGLLSRLFRPGG